jgi:hypothetical protein
LGFTTENMEKKVHSNVRAKPKPICEICKQQIRPGSDVVYFDITPAPMNITTRYPAHSICYMKTIYFVKNVDRFEPLHKKSSKTDKK